MSVYDEIKAEREYQQNRWGDKDDDTHNRPNDYVSYISHYGTRWPPGGWWPYNKMTVDKFRESMIKVAAIAVAAVESIDRQRAANGKTFYEE